MLSFASADELFAACTVLFVAGKGGVGKSTVGATVAIAAARKGCDVVLIELEGYSSLSAVFELDTAGITLGYEPAEVASGGGGSGGAWRLRIAHLRPDDALTRYLSASGLGPIVSSLSRTGAIEIVASAAPGIRDLVTLGRIRQMEQAGVADLIVIDAPASGHTRTLLSTPRAMADSADGGPVKDQADKVLAMLGDPARSQLALVTLAEELPVTETVETAFALEESVGLTLAPVVVNGLWPSADGLDPGGSDAERFRAERVTYQQAQVERLRTELPLDQIHLPFLFNPDFGLAELTMLADAFDTNFT